MRKATCHPTKKYFAKGFCERCYNRQRGRTERVRKVKREYYQKNKKIISKRKKERYKKLSVKKAYQLRNKRWYKKNFNRVKFKHHVYRLNKYGITIEEYDNLLTKQKGKCAVCQCKPKHKCKQQSYLCIDHCHKTGKVRGLLCQVCNKALGMLKDDPQLLKTALNYLLNENV